jgi:aspartate ammonia-lyase
MRTENDSIGNFEVPKDALYGIHSVRAQNNFPDSTRFYIEWFQAVGIVKLACYETYKNYKRALLKKYSVDEIPIPLIDDKIIDSLIIATTELSNGKYFEWFIVPAVQGGAGTSINMNINEIITNVALQKLDQKLGNYSIIDPIEHANIYQSTNDVIPTSLKICVLKLLTELENNINGLRSEIEGLEKLNRNSLRIGYTQMQEAVPTSFGRLFSAYNDALSRDWWRVSKCFERIKIVNLGGSAIGTGITVPQYFLMEVTQTLQRLTGLPVTRAENLADATSNLDSLVEVHAILKAHAVNLEKMANDLRLLASDLSHKEIIFPQKQVGSSIMPGKVNPVIVEFVVSVAHKVYANDVLISSLCGQGCLELNAYIPVIGHAIIESLKLLIGADKTLCDNLINSLDVQTEYAEKRLFQSSSITTALVPFIGYNKASELSKIMKEKKIDIFQANNLLKYIDTNKLKELLQPEKLLKEGFSIQDF